MSHLLWWMLAAALIAVVALELRTHMWLPALAQVLRGQGEREKARSLLEQVIRAPSLFRGGSKPDAHFQIAWLEMEQGRFAEAAEQCRAIFRLPIKPGFASLVHQRLADCLEALGEPDEAARERETAAQELEMAPADAGVHTARARDLVRAGRAAEACEHYEAALAAMPRWNSAGRAEVLVWLALAQYQAGRPEEVSRRAEEAIALNPGPELLMTAHSVASLGYSGRRLLDEAEAHRQTAFQLAEEAGNEDRAANYLASLAGVQRARGKLVEAMQSADKSAAMSFKARRQARLVEAECLWAMGRYDAARTCLEQARNAKPYPQPSEERRSQATLRLAGGMLELDAGEPARALHFLQEAAEELRADPKLALWHDAAMAPVLAALGRAEEARALVAGIEARSPAFAHDTATQERCWAGVGRTLLALDDPAGARSAWLRFLAGPPEPVDRPEGYYFMGECERRLENGEAAWQAYRSAGNLGIETSYARRARKRLQELEAGSTPAAPEAASPPATPAGERAAEP